MNNARKQIIDGILNKSINDFTPKPSNNELKGDDVFGYFIHIKNYWISNSNKNVKYDILETVRYRDLASDAKATFETPVSSDSNNNMNDLMNLEINLHYKCKNTRDGGILSNLTLDDKVAKKFKEYLHKKTFAKRKDGEWDQKLENIIMFVLAEKHTINFHSKNSWSPIKINRAFFYSGRRIICDENVMQIKFTGFNNKMKNMKFTNTAGTPNDKKYNFNIFYNPIKKNYGEIWKELLQYQLTPRWNSGYYQGLQGFGSVYLTKNQNEIKSKFDKRIKIADENLTKIYELFGYRLVEMGFNFETKKVNLYITTNDNRIISEKAYPVDINGVNITLRDYQNEHDIDRAVRFVPLKFKVMGGDYDDDRKINYEGCHILSGYISRKDSPFEAPYAVLKEESIEKQNFIKYGRSGKWDDYDLEFEDDRKKRKYVQSFYNPTIIEFELVLHNSQEKEFNNFFLASYFKITNCYLEPEDMIGKVFIIKRIEINYNRNAERKTNFKVLEINDFTT